MSLLGEKGIIQVKSPRFLCSYLLDPQTQAEIKSKLNAYLPGALTVRPVLYSLWKSQARILMPSFRSLQFLNKEEEERVTENTDHIQVLLIIRVPKESSKSMPISPFSYMPPELHLFLRSCSLVSAIVTE